MLAVAGSSDVRLISDRGIGGAVDVLAWEEAVDGVPNRLHAGASDALVSVASWPHLSSLAG
jgi:hypothetical protein